MRDRECKSVGRDWKSGDLGKRIDGIWKETTEKEKGLKDDSV